MFRHAAILAPLTLLLASCAAYKAAPIDLQRNTEQWRTLSAKACPAGQRLSQQEMHRIGLLLNPSLNEARLAHARSTAVAEFAGLWEDPTLSADVTRVLAESMNNRGVGLSLALPLTGLPGIAKKAAEHYKEADFWTVREKERSYLEELDALRAKILLTHAKHKLMKERLAMLREERDRINRLYELGEVNFSAYQMANQRLNDTINAEQELDSSHLALHLELTNLLGLHPDCRHVEIEEGLPQGIPAATPIPSPATLLANPGLRAQLASYGATEQELKAEIRRQYPQITISGSYGFEDSNDKLGLGIGINLPIWNRNRPAIAKAAGDRSVKQAETISLWKKLMQQASTLADRQQLALKHCRAERERVNTLVAHTERQSQLFAIGESTPLELAESRHETYLRRLSYLDCLGELLDIQIKLQYLSDTK